MRIHRRGGKKIRNYNVTCTVDMNMGDTEHVHACTKQPQTAHRTNELRKELKGWENMFRRKHGRKPTKTDIENSSEEIQAAYLEYQQFKHSSRHKENDDDHKQPLCESSQSTNQMVNELHPTDVAEGVFAPSLNKKHSVEPAHHVVNGGKSERNPTWNFRKSSKLEDLKTVQMSGHKDCTETDGNQSDLRRGDSSSIMKELEILQKSLRVKDSSCSSYLKNCQFSSEELPSPMAGHHCHQLHTSQRLKHAKISSEWMERCYQDLGSKAPSSRTVMNQNTLDEDLGRSGGDLGRSGDDLGRSGVDLGRSGGDLGISGDDLGRSGDDLGRSGGDLGRADAGVNVSSFHSSVGMMPSSSANRCQYRSAPSVLSLLEGKLMEPVCHEMEPDCHGMEPGCHGMEPGCHRMEASKTTIAELSVQNKVRTEAGQAVRTEAGQAVRTEAGQAVRTEAGQAVRTGAGQAVRTEAGQAVRTEAGQAVRTEAGQAVRTEVGQAVRTEAGQAGMRTADSSLPGEVPNYFDKDKKNDSGGSYKAAMSECDTWYTPMSDTSLGVFKETVDCKKPFTGQMLEPSTEKLSRALTETQGALTEKLSGVPQGSTAVPEVLKSSRMSRSVSENFVKLNLKVKRYSRTARRMTGAAYKRQKWKAYHKAMDGDGGKGRSGKTGNTCFKCGRPGHWASNCTEREGSKNLGQFAGEAVREGEEEEEEEMDPAYLAQLSEESPFPSVEAAATMATGIKPRRPSGSKEDCGGPSQPYYPPPPSLPLPSTNSPPVMEPFFSNIPSATPHSVATALLECGHQSFRDGQEGAVLRVLAGISTLLVLPTGAGKSLCYQLPAYLYAQRSPCITLVISPLISLMEDQVRRFPPCLNGACLHANLTHTQKEKVLKDVSEGKVQVLLLSPEALVGGANWGGWSIHSLRRLPPVAFACIDEAHCLSSWSHNFRPSYLRLKKVLKENLGVSCILAITATATKSTAVSVSGHLNIAEDNIIRGTALPDNLKITVSCAEDKEKALVQLLQGPTYSCLSSIIVYCTRQQQTERVAQVLRTCVHMQQASEDEEEEEEEEVVGAGKRRRGNKPKAKKQHKKWSAECYHAGLAASQRRKVQSDFMAGRLRIVVATVAFGMGLNKSDVRAVIHFSMPKSFEAYVQEIGRAGRDGLAAYCHAFIDNEGTDLAELRKHLNGNSADWFTIKQLITKVLPKCRCRQIKSAEGTGAKDEGTGAKGTEEDAVISSDCSELEPYVRCCGGHEVSIVIETLVQALDVSEECLSTMLCYLELDGWVEVLNPVLDTCTVKCYGGHRQLRALAAKVPSVAAAVARLKEKGVDLETASTVSFSVTSLSDSMGWESSIVRSELRSLQNNDRGTSGKPNLASSVMVEFTDLSYHLRCPGDLTSAQLDSLCDQLYMRTKARQEEEMRNLNLLHGVLRSSVEGQQLKHLIQLYFEDSLDDDTIVRLGVHIPKLSQEIGADLRAQISRDARFLVGAYSDRNFTGRAIARIFSGISSPCYPAEVWGRKCNAWRKYISLDFEQLCQLATQELLAMRGH